MGARAEVGYEGRVQRLTRKNFLLGSGAAAASLVLPQCGPQRGASTLHGDGVFDSVWVSDAGRGSEVDAGADAGDGGLTPQCPETAYDSVGPCHRPNAPLRTVLSSAGEGAALFISGTVTGKGCVPIANALVDIWHANAQGTYSDMTVCGASMNAATFQWRGRQTSLANGGWGFQSIYPGSFQQRPIHIHLQVSAPGFVPLVTQIYFLDDPFLGNEPPKPSVLVIPVQRLGAERHGVFNIVLAPA